VLPVYEEVLKLLRKAGADWVQIDEPCLVLDLPEEAHPAFHTAYQRLNAIGMPLFLATYFGGLRDNLPTALSLSVTALHLDCVRQPEELDTVLKQLPADMSLSPSLGANMQFKKFSFGSLRIDETVYDHDVVIDRGKIHKRKKKPFKAI
jgi:5-methyltetrahydropteroyltriglutamate--homocysteine methyltransferase